MNNLISFGGDPLQGRERLVEGGLTSQGGNDFYRLVKLDQLS